jgi:hypothetical protein
MRLFSLGHGLRLVGVAVVVGGLLGLAGAAPASVASSTYSAPLIAFWDGTSWTQQVGPDPDGSGRLTAVVALSTTDVWALGSYGGESKFGNALAERWDGSSWQQVAIPTPTGANEAHLYGAAAISATNIWAVGSWAGSQFSTLIEHWDGSTWTIVPSPQPGFSRQLYGVATLSATDVWAVGYYQRSVKGFAYFRPLVLHWNGTKWTRVKSPHPGWHSDSRLAGVAAVSPRSVWAVGTYTSIKSGHFRTTRPGSARTLILHWDGKTWRRVPSPSRGSSSNLVTAAAAGRKNVWAVGYWQNAFEAGPMAGQSGGQTLVEQWNGHKWRIVYSAPSYKYVGNPTSPGAYQNPTSLAVLKDDDIWVAGQQQNLGLSYSTLSMHWDGHAWSPVPSPNPAPDDWFSGIAAATPTAVWAVGTYFPAAG